MLRALIIWLRLRRAELLGPLGLLLGLAGIPLARMPIPGLVALAHYAHTIVFHLSPIPAAAIYAQLARRGVTSLELVNGVRVRLVFALGTLVAVALVCPVVMIPALSHPIAKAVATGAIEVVVITLGISLLQTFGVPWFMAGTAVIPLVLVLPALSDTWWWRTLISHWARLSVSLLAATALVMLARPPSSREVASW